ncbi:protein dead ringer isoform X3 [Harmonia axyridis]|uniref:protein dead ringer isoform X3 n=1 Tax=Harmonia axyridis TaxID=115357 RepID=UPI001E27594F|nr:protein dead ringer isoform X3 [Harmonia axyridis]
MDMDQQERESEIGEESPMSHNEDEISDGDDSMRDNDEADSAEENRIPHNSILGDNHSMLAEHGDVLSKLKMQVGSIKPGEEFDMRQLERQLNFTNMAQFQERFQVPAPFPFPHPAAAFLPPMSQPQAAQPPSSASSHSSEGSASSQTTWSFEEQFKQLYEINDDPKRKEFLDDLFSFMQKRGTPINRLPIMAKSVLDLYELYNLVIARGGLVDVINKKLWQEIIKGLHLPSSITSAAFTLRTQYMKYLYPYECEKRNLSSPGELQAAIDGNRREGRRSGYSQYEAMSRVQNPSNLPSMQQMQQMQQMQLNRMTTAMAAQEHAIVASLMECRGRTLPSNGVHKVNAPESGLAIPNGVHPSHPQPMGQPTNGPIPGLAPNNELEARMMKYVEYLNKEIRNNAAIPPVPIAPQMRNDVSPTPSQSMHPYELSRMALWNMYNNNQAPVEPQREALNLANGTAMPRSPSVKEELDESLEDCSPSPKKMRIVEESPAGPSPIPSTATNIKIDTRGDIANGDSSMVVSMEFNGIKYQGVLFAQTTETNRTSSSS